MARCLVFLYTLFLTNTIFASVSYDHILTTNGTYSLNINQAEKKFEDVLLEEELILKNFNPADVKILKKTVTGNDFEYYVEKKILGFTKRFQILGTVNIERVANGCSAGENAYLAYFDFSRSGSDVTEAVAALSLAICTKAISETSLQIKTTNSMYYRGRKYGMITEPIAKSVINDQINEFFNAVKSTANTL
jgi:hypothetical protein